MASRIASVASLRDYLAATGPFDVAIWDFDGVVGDTEPVQARVYREMLSERDITVNEDFFHDLAGRSELEIWSTLKQRYDFEGEVKELRHERIGRVAPMLADGVRPNWFVRPGTASLQETNTRLLLLSSGNVEVVVRCLAAWGLRELFDEVSATTGQGDVPKRERLRQALTGTGRALVIEDSTEYLKLASELGAVTLGVDHTMNGDLAGKADAILVERLEREPRENR